MSPLKKNTETHLDDKERFSTNHINVTNVDNIPYMYTVHLDVYRELRCKRAFIDFREKKKFLYAIFNPMTFLC